VKVEEGTPAVPAARRHIIRRPRLTRMLDECGARIILLVAPAGYGKTTLAREWLGDPSRQATWYTCNAASSDIALLAAGLARATANVIPGAGERMMQRLRATDRPDEDAAIFSEMLADDLVDWPQAVWIAIDDYQFASGSHASERFVEALIERTAIPILLTTRKRPSWAIARKRMYGEIFELDRTALSMSDEEARAVLATASQDSSAIIESAAGWPAVIGLAAISTEMRGRAGDVPPTLLAYFAEELYQAVEAARRWDLCQLAIPPALSTQLVQDLVGDGAAEVLELAGNLGVITTDVHNDPEIHPLIQHFLRSKLAEHDSTVVQAAVRRVGTFYIAHQDWDSGFAVASAFDDTELAVAVIKAGLEDVLAQGRVSTVAHWLEFATDRFADDPILDLAEAELAFRQGAHPQTEVLAHRAATRLSRQGSVELAARAHARAGRAAHLAGDEGKALIHHDAALRLTRRPITEREALWGKFVTLLQSENTESAESVFESLARKNTGHVDEALRLASGGYLLAMYTGRRAPDIDALLAAHHLLPRCSDPMVRSTFLNSCAGGLAFAGRYAEADTIARQQVEDALAYRLGFALPHAYLRRASAACGLRRFRDARAYLDEADAAAKDVHQQWVDAAISILRGLTLLATGNAKAALRVTDPQPQPTVNPSLRGEYFGVRALAFACIGDSDVSNALQEKARHETTAVESTALRTLSRAVAAHTARADEAEALSRRALDFILSTMEIDYFVIAYRACPDLLASVVEGNEDHLRPIIFAARDDELASSVGLAQSRPPRAPEGILSPREREVWHLMARGMSNREIAGELYLSESTVKVHVRHVFEKLGAKTRVEAVIKGQALFSS
jgi:LuxR family maltose regulon positive regulatory protein